MLSAYLLAAGEEELSSSSTCTHTGWTQAGTKVIPIAGSTIVWRKDGSWGTVDCSTVEYYQPDNGGAFGVN